jgi:FlaA1/EpsC-like NDP-sugar epimerase
MYKLVRLITLLVIDVILVTASVLAAYLLRFDFEIPELFIGTLPYVFSVIVPIMIGSFYVFKIYRKIWQYANVADLFAIFNGTLLGTGVFYLFHQLVHQFYSEIVVPRSMYPLTFITVFLVVGCSRVVWRLIRNSNTKKMPHHRKALIVGAGEAGVLVARELKREHSEQYPVAFIDDNLQKKHYEVTGIPVVGTREDIPQVVKHYGIDEIIIAIPSAPRLEISKIINIAKGTGCRIKIVPSVNDLINGKITINTLRKVSVEDLLGREPVKVDLNEIADYLRGKVVLVTGAGGSIGSEICRQVASIEPDQLLLLDHSENNIYDIEIELKKRFPSLSIVALIADIKDEVRMRGIFGQFRPDVVFHAAAHKHVPLMEGNPKEAVMNNVFGTRNVALCAHEFKVKRFVLISTDKAVNPTSVMGTTKRIAEMIVQDLNRRSQTLFSAVRFGNVLGSRGSVIPLFQKQIEEGGPVTVTHPDMIRYFMTIPEAVQLVIQAGAYTTGGEIFILDMGNPVKIDDLAHDLIRLSGLEPGKDIQIVYTGMRPGEKLFEELLSKEEGATATKHDRIYVGGLMDLPVKQLDRLLNDLKEATTPEEVKLQLQRLVPEYRPSNSGIDSIQTSDQLQASLEIVATLDRKYEMKESVE